MEEDGRFKMEDGNPATCNQQPASSIKKQVIRNEKQEIK